MVLKTKVLFPTQQVTESKTHTEPSRPRPVIVAVKRKDHLRTEHISQLQQSPLKPSPHQDKKPDEKRSPQAASKKPSPHRETKTTEQRKVEIRSKHLKLHVYRDGESSGSLPPQQEPKLVQQVDHERDPDVANARSRYMAWYQQKRAEMECKRRERKEAEEEQQRPRWLKRAAAAGKARNAKSADDPEQRPEDKKVGEKDHFHGLLIVEMV